MPIVGMVVQPTLDSDVYEESALSCLPTLLITLRKQDIRPEALVKRELDVLLKNTSDTAAGVPDPMDWPQLPLLDFFYQPQLRP